MDTFLKLLFLLFILFQNLFSLEIELTQKEKDFLKSHPSITLGSDHNWIPYIIKNEDGTISGYDADILKEVNQLTGANFKLVTGTWKDIVQKAKLRKIDGLATSAVHKERREYFDFSNVYITTQRLLIVSNLNPKNIKSVKDLKDKKIGYQKKNLFEEKLVSKYKDSISVPFEDYNGMLEAIVKGKIDVIVGSHPLIYFAQKKSFPFIKIINTIPNSNLDLVFSLRKDYPEALSILNKGLSNISYEDRVKIHSKWFFGSKNTNIETLNQIGLTEEEQRWLQNKKEITVANVGTYAPFNFSMNAEAKGYSIDYMKLVGKYLGVDVKFVNKPWKEHFNDIKNGSLDIIPHLVKNKKREAFVDFTNFYHLEYFTGITIRKSSDIDSFEDLVGKKVAVGEGTWLHKHLIKEYPNLDFIPIALKEGNIQLEWIESGKIDAYIGSIPTLNYLIRKSSIPGLKTKRIKGLGVSDKVALPMAVKKGNKILLSILEKTNDIIPQKEFIKLSNNWLNLEKNQPLNKSLLSKEALKYLRKKEVIKICVLPNWLPFEQIDENRQHKGIGADIIKIISKKLDMKFVLVPTKEWGESLKNIRARKCDILPVAMNVPSRRDAMNFTEPYVKEPFVIATTDDKFYIRDINDLSNKKIGIVKSYAIMEVLKQQNPLIKVVAVNDTKEGLEKVSRGELYGYVDIMPTIGYFIQKYGLFDLKIAGKLSSSIDLSIATRNDEPLLNEIMQNALDTISEEEFRKIVGRWIEIKVHQEFDYRQLFYVISIFLLILLVVLYKNRSIHKINKKLELAHNAISEQQQMVDKHVMILTTDLEGKIVGVNEAYCTKVGYKEEELIGFYHNVIRHPDMSQEFFSALWETISNDKMWYGEIKNLTKDRRSVYFNVVIEPLLTDGRKVGYRSISEDITDKKRIEELSVTDKLTGLFNRMKTDTLLVAQEDLFKRYKTEFSIVLLDIDNFKSINDNFGHDVGDEVLKKLASVIQENVRKTDYVGRWGGEEFLIICQNTNCHNAYLLAEKIRNAIQECPFMGIGNQTVSLGVAEFNKEITITELFKLVDNSLYEAKHSGKNKTVCSCEPKK